MRDEIRTLRRVMMIITNDLIKKALELAQPSIEEILNTEGLTWGPKWVEGHVEAPGIEGYIPFKFGDVTKWKSEWGQKREPFFKIAAAKLHLGSRLGENTSEIVAKCPWILEDGEYLYAGCASRFGINVAISGAYGRVDEAIGNIIIDCIIMLAHLEADVRISRHQMQI